MNDRKTTALRKKIDSLDDRIAGLILERIAFSRMIQDAKPSPIKYSPAREKEILDRLSGEARKVYFAILQVARKWEPIVKWFRIASEDDSGDIEQTLFIRSVFGEIPAAAALGFTEIASLTRSFDEEMMIPCMVVAAGGVRPEGAMKKFFHLYASYRRRNRTVFSVFSNIPPEGGAASISL